MEFSFFSLVMSIIFFSTFILLVSLFRRSNKFIISFNTFPIILLIGLSIIRIIFNFEFIELIDISSSIIFPEILDFLRSPISPNTDILISQALLFIWISGILIMILKNIYSYYDFTIQLNNISKTSYDQDIIILENIKSRLNIKNKINIYRSDEIIIPIVIGILNHNIYLPDTYICKNDLNYILLHEVNHIKNRDNLIKLIILLLKVIFWWNPLVYILNRDVDHILEIQCDLRTTSSMNGEDRTEYLRSIINIIENSKDKSTSLPAIEHNLKMSTLYNSDENKLKQRFSIVLNYYNNHKSNILNKLSKILLYSIIIVLFLSSYIFTLKPHYLPDEEGIYYIEGEDFKTEIDDNFIFKEKGKEEVLWRESQNPE